jgi:hypothetical protein
MIAEEGDEDAVTSQAERTPHLHHIPLLDLRKTMYFYSLSLARTNAVVIYTRLIGRKAGQCSMRSPLLHTHFPHCI